MGYAVLKPHMGGSGAEHGALLCACWSDVYLDGRGELLLGTKL